MPITDKQKGLVFSVTFLFIALYNMIFHYQLLQDNPIWGIFVCFIFVVGVAGTIMTLPNKHKTPSPVYSKLAKTDTKASTPIKGIITKLRRLVFTENYADKIGQAAYGITDNGIFGARIVAGIITGIRLTEDKPLYEISYEKNSWWVKDITDNRAELLDMLKVAQLDHIRKTAKINLKHHD